MAKRLQEKDPAALSATERLILRYVSQHKMNSFKGQKLTTQPIYNSR